MFEDKTTITATWINIDGGGQLDGFYTSNGALAVNADEIGTQVCRCRLRNKYDHSDEFEVVIIAGHGNIIFRADCYEDVGGEYHLDRFDSQDGGEIILVHQDEMEIIYFHLF
ncbi:MAG: hypothetical protein ACYCQH_08370 [Acidithiobacillus ferrooxidans]|uniref:hypothetical protein n=1 Tax=Acidithiobacillus ferrooxidans TaxID=920 RepID=UPI0013D47AC3|nr:hypothetical protein [Acidithiobacillus ferrooxidans]MDA8152263.1 hypothetical protein [Acidithiobacillus sp.]MDA8378504.1 hypothetical protein [Planctomycetia bacterium]MBU2858180.1 hypothetical protein [Acidithiobacillus ferrooxidans]MBU2860424.1 hypothetical protein [Acidithiobacillus ferrooxidans]MCR2829401.1 hypothetical protein [Acidithiobacillus ferrooxidans]